MDYKNITIAIMLFIVLLLIIVLLIIPIKMANKRGRAAWFWFLFSLIFSPFLSMLFLFFLGETKNKRRERIIEEEKIRNSYRNSERYSSTYSVNDREQWLKANPDKTFSDYYNR